MEKFTLLVTSNNQLSLSKCILYILYFILYTYFKDDFAFDSTQTIDNIDNKLAEYTQFKIDSREYPESLMKNDPNVISEFDSIIKEKHESDYIFESS